MDGSLGTAAALAQKLGAQPGVPRPSFLLYRAEKFAIKHFGLYPQAMKFLKSGLAHSRACLSSLPTPSSPQETSGCATYHT